MFKYTLKNYIKNFKYAFVVIGIVYSGLILSLAVFFAGIGGFTPEVFTAGDRVGVYIGEVIGKLTAEQLFDGGFLETVIYNIGEILISGSGASAAGIAGFMIFAAAIFLLSMKAADMVTKIMIRGTINTREKRGGIIAMLVRYGISLGNVTLFTYLTYKWPFSAFLMIFLYFILKAVENIVEVKLLYYPQNNLKEMLKFDIAVKLGFFNLLAVIINIILIGILAQAIGILPAVIIGIPLIIYSLLIVEFTAVAYFKDMKASGKI